MYRSFGPQSRQMRGKGEGAYSKQSVTESLTTQMAALRPNASGGGSYVASLCCALGHVGLHYAPSGAPRSAAKLLAAIGTATSSEVPQTEETNAKRSIYRGRRASGGTGRRAGFRIQWGDPSEFESLLAHVDRRFEPQVTLHLASLFAPANVVRAASEARRSHGRREPRRSRVQQRAGCAPQASARTTLGSAKGASVTRGSSSVVEHRLAKARVASSNLVFR
jgi:hypothetical protein